jgi:hypothetical protein
VPRTRIITSFEMKPGTMFWENDERLVYVVMESVFVKRRNSNHPPYKDRWIHELRSATEDEKIQFEAINPRIMILNLMFEVKPKTMLCCDGGIYLITNFEYNPHGRSQNFWVHEARTLTEKERLIHEVMES